MMSIRVWVVLPFGVLISAFGCVQGPRDVSCGEDADCVTVCREDCRDDGSELRRASCSTFRPRQCQCDCTPEACFGCADVDVHWTINSNSPSGGSGWVVELRFGDRAPRTELADRGYANLGRADPGVYELVANLQPAGSSFPLDTQVVSDVVVDGENVDVNIDFSVIGMLDIQWTVNGGANCPAGAIVTASWNDGTIDAPCETQQHTVYDASVGADFVSLELRTAGGAHLAYAGRDFDRLTPGASVSAMVDICCELCPNAPPTCF